MPKHLSPYKRHVARWHKCKMCDLYHSRKKVVLLRGSVPSPVLFVGEAPGQSEDVLGFPFVGPAGQLLDRIIEQAGLTQGCAFTNIIACIPKNDEGVKVGQPSKESIKACGERLVGCVVLCQPHLIVWVGECAAKNGPKILEKKGVEWDSSINIIHPAAIMRMNVSQQGLAVQRCIVAIADAVEDLEV